MEARSPENVSNAIQPAEANSAQISQHINNPSLNIENQLHGISDIASARNFFVPKVDMPAIASTIPGLENSAGTAAAAAAKAASGAISPMLQLIMRLPGHLGIFNSFLDVLKSLFMPHDLLSSFNPSVFVPGVDLTHGLTHISQSLAHAPGFDLSMLSSSAQGFHNMAGDLMNSAGSPHLHMNAFDSLKQSANVSAGVDLNNPQFEGISGTAAHQASGSMSGQFSARGDSLAGPSLSAQAITPKLAPAQRIFSNKFFESASGNSNSNTLLAANTPSATTGVTSNAASTGQVGASADSLPVSHPATEHIAAAPSSAGMHAKALSLNDVLHNKHLPALTLHKQIASNPFSQLASNAKQAFQAGKSMHLSSANHEVVSHIPSIKAVGASGIDHSSMSGQYTVKPGDSLWQISKNTLGSGDKWSQLYKLNSSTIGANPNMIYSGQKLALSGFDAHQAPQQLAHHAAPAHVNHIEHQIASQHQPATHHVTPAQVNHVEHQIANQPHSAIAHPSAPQLAPQVPQLAHHAPAPAAANHVKHESIVAQAPISTTQNHGLAVNNNPEHVLTGSGGAQAATNAHTVVNKSAMPNSTPAAKSVVSFSLTPDLSFLDNK